MRHATQVISKYRKSFYGIVAFVAILDAALFALVTVTLTLRPESAMGFIIFGFAGHMIVMSMAFIFVFHRGFGPMTKLRNFITDLNNDPDTVGDIHFRREDFVKEIQPDLQKLRDGMRNRKSGESLLTVLIAGVIGTIILMGIITGITNSQKGTRQISDNLDLQEVTYITRYVLSSETSCKKSLSSLVSAGPLDLKNHPDHLANKDFKVISDDGAGHTHTELDVGLYHNIRIQSVRFSSDAPSDLGNGSLLAKLIITAQKNEKASTGSEIISSEIAMNIVYDSSTGAPSGCTAGIFPQINECYSGEWGFEWVTHSSPITEMSLKPTSPAGTWRNSLTVDRVMRIIHPGGTDPSVATIAAMEPGFAATGTWGLQCQNGWTATSCSFYSPSYFINNGTGFIPQATAGDMMAVYPTIWDSDHALIANSCVSDEEEHQSGGRVVLTCCRMASPF